jgi:hypothetical protein
MCPERVDAARHRPQQVPARFRVPPGPLFSEELLEDVLSKAVAGVPPGPLVSEEVLEDVLSKAVAEVVLWNASIHL